MTAGHGCDWRWFSVETLTRICDECGVIRPATSSEAASTPANRARLLRRLGAWKESGVGRPTQAPPFLPSTTDHPLGGRRARKWRFVTQPKGGT